MFIRIHIKLHFDIQNCCRILILFTGDTYRSLGFTTDSRAGVHIRYTKIKVKEYTFEGPGVGGLNPCLPVFVHFKGRT